MGLRCPVNLPGPCVSQPLPRGEVVSRGVRCVRERLAGGRVTHDDFEPPEGPRGLPVKDFLFDSELLPLTDVRNRGPGSEEGRRVLRNFPTKTKSLPWPTLPPFLPRGPDLPLRRSGSHRRSTEQTVKGRENHGGGRVEVHRRVPEGQRT